MLLMELKNHEVKKGIIQSMGSIATFSKDEMDKYTQLVKAFDNAVTTTHVNNEDIAINQYLELFLTTVTNNDERQLQQTQQVLTALSTVQFIEFDTTKETFHEVPANEAFQRYVGHSWEEHRYRELISRHNENDLTPEIKELIQQRVKRETDEKNIARKVAEHIDKAPFKETKLVDLNKAIQYVG